MNLDYIDNEQAQGYIASRHHNNDGVYVPLAYIDMVNGKMSDAILFSQIMYWHEPGKNGHTKMRVVYDGHRWIAKNHNEWYEETRLKNSTVRNALNRLKGLELIHYKVTGYSGNKTPLIRVNWETFINLLNSGRGEIAPIGHNVADNPLNSGQPNTENTTKTTIEKDSSLQKQSDADSHICNVCKKPITTDGWLTDGMEELAICGECYANQDVKEGYIVDSIGADSLDDDTPGHDIDLPHYLPGVAWIEGIWDDTNTMTNMCVGCNGEFEHDGRYYYQGNYSNPLCPGCYLKRNGDTEATDAANMR